MNIKINDDLAELLLEYLRASAGKEFARGKRSVAELVDAVMVDFINKICVDGYLDFKHCNFNKLEKMYDAYLVKHGK